VLRVLRVLLITISII
jgi:hypothetical protein